jgi:hypothetical protein
MKTNLKIILLVAVTFFSINGYAQNMTFGQVYNWTVNDIICFTHAGTGVGFDQYKFGVLNKEFNNDSSSVDYIINVDKAHAPTLPNGDWVYETYLDTVTYGLLKDSIYNSYLNNHIGRPIIPTYTTYDTLISHSLSFDNWGLRNESFFTAGCNLNFESCSWNSNFIEGIGGFGEFDYPSESAIRYLVFQYAIKNNYQDTIGDFTTSISEALKPVSYKIYPNPAEEYVSIDLPIMYNTGTLQIYNLQGQLVKSVTITTGGTQSVRVAEMPNGIYTLVVYSAPNKLLGREKLVVLH